jgi:hypothetical protein
MSQHNTRGTSRADPPPLAARAGRAPRGVSGLRINALAAVVMLLIEYGLGIWVNLYAQVPAEDHGKGTFAALGAAVAHGPVALAVHAVLGTLLLVTAIGLIVRAALARKAAATVIGAIAFCAILAAWLSGARFVGDAAAGASFGMAIATGVALLGYEVILFASGLTEGSDR